VGAPDPLQPDLEGETKEVSEVALGRDLPLLQAGHLLLQESGQEAERRTGAAYLTALLLPCLELIPAVRAERH
jgi:hypothetical protein